MRRLENEDEEKFWEAWVKDDLIFCYRYGKIGSSGHTKLKKFKTKAEAEAELEAKLAEKLEEGFEEPDAEEAQEEEDEEAEEDEEPDDDDDDSEDEDAAPKKKGRATAPIVIVAPPAKPTLPSRVKARMPTPDKVEAAIHALEALRAATVVAARSWKLARLARRARHALEALGGTDLSRHQALASALDAVTGLVLAPKNRLPLEDALTLLWVVDTGTYARTVAGWRARMIDSAATPSIGVLSAAFENIPDHEVAVHVGTALVNRRLSPDAFERWFARIKPFLVEALADKSRGFEVFRGALKPGSDAVLRARVAEVVP